MGILSGDPTKEPMHYGEVFATWSYLLTAKAAVASYQTKLNHAGDDDLKTLLNEAIENSKQENKQIEELLKSKPPV